MIKKAFLTLFLLLSVFGASAQEECREAIFASVGGLFHSPRTDYVSKFGGFDVGFTAILPSANVYMVDVAFAGGKAHKDFPTGEGMILDDDGLTYCHLYLNYGRVVRQTERTQLYPFFGMGISGYEFAYDEEDDIYFTKNAFSVNTGISYDIHLNTSTWMSQSISIKPYASVSFYNGPLHVVPSFNLAVTWNFGFSQ